jgi:hypothetical protein
MIFKGFRVNDDFPIRYILNRHLLERKKGRCFSLLNKGLLD